MLEIFRDAIMHEISELRTECRGKFAAVNKELAGVTKELAVVNKELVDLRAQSAAQGVMLNRLCQQAGVSITSLGLLTPLALTGEEPAASTPSASSVTSNISSTSGLPIGNLTIDSPTIRTTGPPVAGPSGIGRERSPVQGALSYFYYTFMMTLTYLF